MTAVAVTLSIVMLYFAIPLGAPLVDGFHEGEYLASRLYFPLNGAMPVMIHGAMDVLPAQVAIFLAGEARTIAATRLVNGLVCLTAGLMFVHALAQLGRPRARGDLYAVAGLAVLLVANTINPLHFAIQLWAPGIRDVFLIGIAWLLVRAAQAQPARHDRLLAVAAVVAALTVFWSYNRIVPTLALLGSYSLALAAASHRPRPVLIPALGGLSSLVLLALSGREYFAGHIASMLYWQAHDRIWTLPWFDRPAIAIGAVCVGAALYAGLVGILEWRERVRDKADPRPAALALALGCCTVAMLAGQLNRFDLVHAVMTVPFAVLAIAAARAALAAQATPAAMSGIPANSLLPAGLAMLLFGLLAVGVGPRSAENLTIIVAGLPNDQALIAPRYQAAAAFIRAQGGTCTYAFDNQAAFYHLTGMRPCSRFMIPVYAGPDAEPVLIADLQREAPRAVVWTSAIWSSAIDGLPQAQRTPRVSAWLAAHYRPAARFGDIVVATIRPWNVTTPPSLQRQAPTPSSARR